jgi:Xaa-Pro dipeptidase
MREGVVEILESYRSRLVPKEMAFSEAEYRARLDRVREAMGAKGLDLLLLHHLPSVCYLTGYQTPVSDWYNCLIVPLEGDLALQVCDFEVGLALVHTTVERILSVRWNRMDEAATQLVELLGAANVDRKRIGIESRRTGLNAHAYQLLRDRFPRTHLVDGSDLVPRIRALKSPAEIDCLRQAGRLSVAGLDAAIRAMRPGVTENAVAAAAAAAMIEAGSEFFCTDPWVRAGHRSGIIHATYKRHFVKPGDPVIIELGAVYQRYTAPLYGTAVMGRPPDRLRRLADTALAALALLYENVRAGRTADDVARAAAKGLAGVDPEVYLSEYHAYPVGLGFPPEWSEDSIWIVEGSQEVLRPGMTFHGVRSLRIPGLMAAGFSETIAVTEAGCEILTPHRRELAVV